jgi:hypothetical protein
MRGSELWAKLIYKRYLREHTVVRYLFVRMFHIRNCSVDFHEIWFGGSILKVVIRV